MQTPKLYKHTYLFRRQRGCPGFPGYCRLLLLALLLLAAGIAAAQDGTAASVQAADEKGIPAGFLPPPPAETALLDQNFFSARPALTRGLLLGVSAGGAALGLGGVQVMLTALSNAMPVFGAAPAGGQPTVSLSAEVHAGLLYTISGITLTAAALLCYSLLE